MHRSKSEIFQKDLASSGLTARPGVLDTIAEAKRAGTKVGLVTTTSPANVAALFEVLAPGIAPGDFDVVVDTSRVTAPKPDAAAYTHALEALGERPQDCVAVEDNGDGVSAAAAAGVPCVAFPGANTTAHGFDAARRVVDRLDPADLLPRH